MNKIAEVDFGKQRRDLERQLNHLLGIAERRRGELETDPVRLYMWAVSEILSLKGFVEELDTASWRRDAISTGEGGAVVQRPAMTEIDTQDYDRCGRVLKLLARGPIKVEPPTSDKTA